MIIEDNTSKPLYEHSGNTLFNANLRGANLSSADLSSADLINANLINTNLINTNLINADLRDADLWDTTGNGREIQTIQTPQYTVNLFHDMIQIGCECHKASEWFEFSEERIRGMDGDRALNWRHTWKEIILLAVNARGKSE